MKTRIAILSLVIGLVAIACGDDDATETTAAGTTTTTAAGATTTTTAAATTTTATTTTTAATTTTTGPTTTTTNPCPGCIVVTNNMFSPASRTVLPGATVGWSFQQGTHTTTSDPSSAETWDSGNTSSGTFFYHMFNVPGTFTYFCSVHGAAMSGSITVSP
ncbi:MAG TPA: hypothetical protein VJA44_06000 [Acidimicrobiia bacterium]|nr:hypothetical protein [Acidimicrobiia bacterium]